MVADGAILLVPDGYHDRRRRDPGGLDALGQQVGEQARKPDGQPHTGIGAVALTGQVVIAAAGADGSQGLRPLQEGLVDRAGVVVQTAGDLQVGDDRARPDAGGLINDHGQCLQPLNGQGI